MKRRLALMLATVLMLPASLPANAGDDFVDVDDNVHEQTIAAIAAQGITKGCNPPANDRFCPDRTVTRGEFAAFLVRSLDITPASGHDFRDVGGSVFAQDIAALAASGITRGCNPPDNTRFCPGRRLSRGELAALLARALDLPETNTDYFTDDAGSIFEGDINRLASAGITRGCGDFRYCAERSLPRDEMASFLVRMLRGGGDPPPTPPTGPTGSVPADAVVIRPGDDAQRVIDRHPAGTAFLLASGTHRVFSVEPKTGNSFYGESGTVLSGTRVLSGFQRRGGAWVAGRQTQQAPAAGKCESGTACQLAEGLWIDGKELRQVTSLASLRPGSFYFDYAGDALYLADDPRGRLVETSVAQHAFTGDADDVAITGLVIEKYATPGQKAAIEPSMHSDQGKRWTVSGSEIRFIHGAGLKLGHGMKVVGSHIHHNGWMGIHGASGFSDAEVRNSELSHNCIGGFLCFGWGGGGMKAGQGVNLVVANTDVHHNSGKGLHVDNGMSGVRLTGNHVYDNAGAGIMVEISNRAVVESNVVQRNGFDQGNGAPGPGIAVLSSTSVTIRGNVVTLNGHGVVVRRTSRGPVDHISVVSNDISMDSGVTGVYDDTGSEAYGRDIEFRGNTYDLGSKSRYYFWAGSQRTASEWRGFGNDLDGTWK